MSSGLTIGELRAALEGLADDLPVMVHLTGDSDHLAKRAAHLGRMAVPAGGGDALAGIPMIVLTSGLEQIGWLPDHEVPHVLDADSDDSGLGFTVERLDDVSAGDTYTLNGGADQHGYVPVFVLAEHAG